MNTIDTMAVKSIRFLSADAIEKSKSGHPGLPIGSAPMAYTIWKQMKHNPANPQWQGRDRFVLSAGHASMLEYALLHLFGYGLTIEDIKNFRQWGSLTPGHPEYRHTAGVEATSGPLGQGIAMAVGMAMAEAHMAAHFNREGYPVVDNYTYALCGDGCLQEGVASEAASFAGTQKLGKLILFYDRNYITIEGRIECTFGEDVNGRFEAYGWHVQELPCGEDMDAIAKAIEAAKAVADKPSVIIVNTEIAYGTPKQGKASAHGEPLGEEAVKAMREFYQWDYAPFDIPAEVYAHFDELKKGYAAQEAKYNEMFEGYKAAYPELYAEWQQWHSSELPEALLNDARLTAAEKPVATRAAGGTVLNIIAEYLPNLFGGSADLAPSNKSDMKGKAFFSPEDRDGANIHFGIREFAMAAMCNGIMLYGGLRAYCATFMVFVDYLKPAMRLAALMKLPVIYILTHDSIGVGEDGPTHQPIEQLLSVRSIPDAALFRPADMTETAGCYIAALQGSKPSAMALTRQNLPQYAETSIQGTLKGGYVLKDCPQPDVILIATGSEVELAVKAAEVLGEKGKAAKVVSMPCVELFEEQSAEYKESVLPAGVRARVAVEAGCSMGWYKYVGMDGEVIGIDRFGASAPAGILFKEFGFTVENVVAAAERVMK
ncbi:MAG: transketolase [Clostridia bacterium]|nr:transketolase [Clostridia bacterium]